LVPQRLCQHGNYEAPIVISPQQNEREIYDLVEDGVPAFNLYDTVENSCHQKQTDSGQCNVYEN